jgi:uncharacterized Zn finger protein
MEFRLTCQKCGDHEISIPDNATDESTVTCASCGIAHCTWGELREATLRLAQEEATKQFQESIGEGSEGVEGIEFHKGTE